MTALWIYLVGPIVGAILGWGIYRGAEAVGESTAAT
jgi:glycerol uptake facilitator-like aquaporin